MKTAALALLAPLALVALPSCRALTFGPLGPNPPTPDPEIDFDHIHELMGFAVDVTENAELPADALRAKYDVRERPARIYSTVSRATTARVASCC